MDGGNRFLMAHQTLKVRRGNREAPDWALNDKTIQEILLRAFPKLKTDDVQRQRAGRWARVIQIYFRSGKSYRETAHELGEKLTTVHRVIQRIRRTVAGRPTNGCPRIKKIRVPVQTPDRDED